MEHGETDYASLSYAVFEQAVNNSLRAKGVVPQELAEQMLEHIQDLEHRLHLNEQLSEQGVQGHG
jgi:hypothetical protein